jgi:small subunit ribosomal protein S21
MIKRKSRNNLSGLRVEIEDGKFESSLRAFKRKVDNANLIREVRERQEYVKPSTKRKVAKNAARKRWLKKLSLSQMKKKLY